MSRRDGSTSLQPHLVCSKDQPNDVVGFEPVVDAAAGSAERRGRFARAVRKSTSIRRIPLGMAVSALDGCCSAQGSCGMANRMLRPGVQSLGVTRPNAMRA